MGSSSGVGSRLFVTDPGHAIVPGVRTSEFLEVAEQNGFFWFAVLLVAMLEGTIFEKWYHPHEGSKDDMLEAMKAFLRIFHECNGGDPSEDATRSDNISAKGYGYQLTALSLIWNKKMGRTGIMDYIGFREETGWSERFPVEEFKRFQSWLARYLIQKTDAVIWRVQDRKSMVSASGISAYLPFGSAFKGQSIPEEQFLIGFPKRITPKAKPVVQAPSSDADFDDIHDIDWDFGALPSREKSTQPFNLVSMGFLVPVGEVLSLSPHLKWSHKEDSLNPNRFCMEYTEILTGTGGKQFYTKNLPAADSLESAAILRKRVVNLLLTHGSVGNGGGKLDVHATFPQLQKEALSWTARFLQQVAILKSESSNRTGVHFSSLNVDEALLDAALSKVMGSTCDLARVAHESLRLRLFDEEELAWLLLLAKSESRGSEKGYQCLDEFLLDPEAFKILVSWLGSDLKEGRAMVKVRVNDGAVTYIAFSPDGRPVRTEGMDLVSGSTVYSYSYYPVLGAEDLLVAIDRGDSKTTVSVVKTPSSGVTDDQKAATKNALLIDHDCTVNPFPLTEKELGDVTEFLSAVNSTLQGAISGVRTLEPSDLGALSAQKPGLLILSNGVTAAAKKLSADAHPGKWMQSHGKLAELKVAGGILFVYGVVTAGKPVLHAYFEKK